MGQTQKISTLYSYEVHGKFGAVQVPLIVPPSIFIPKSTRNLENSDTRVGFVTNFWIATGVFAVESST